MDLLSDVIKKGGPFFIINIFWLAIVLAVIVERSVYFLGRGPLAAALEARIAALGLGARVHLMGEVQPSRLAAWYSAANLLLLTSSREGRPNVVLEALASGLPVLATAAGGTGELLEAWRDRSYSQSREPLHLAKLLADLLEAPPARAALRASVEPLSWERGLAALEDCLAAAIDGAARL